MKLEFFTTYKSN